jgi:predicted ABC-type ATPase
MDNRPQVIVLAGPNGAGKSTSAPEVIASHIGVSAFVNADVIARGLSGFAPENADLAAGRIMLGRLRELAKAREDFAFETTLSSRTFGPWLAELCSAGYEFHLCYVWVHSPDLAVERVRRRFESGGHTVPEPDVRRRYVRSAANFFEIYKPLAATWRCYDNSGVGGPPIFAHGGLEGPDTIVIEPTWRLFRSVADAAKANS